MWVPDSVLKIPHDPDRKGQSRPPQRARSCRGLGSEPATPEGWLGEAHRRVEAPAGLGVEAHSLPAGSQGSAVLAQRPRKEARGQGAEAGGSAASALRADGAAGGSAWREREGQRPAGQAWACGPPPPAGEQRPVGDGRWHGLGKLPILGPTGMDRGHSRKDPEERAPAARG